MLMSLPGPELDGRLATALDRGLAGVILFARNIQSSDQLAGLTAQIREHKQDAIIALDEEGGEVTRLEADSGSSWPGARALGLIDDPLVTTAVAGSVAASLRRAGVNLNLAPVADVATNEDNPVIGNRSFSSSPETVARHVTAWIQGSRDQGVASCVKHFPGHGDTFLDSHLTLPTVDLPEEQLLASHVAPFRAAIEAGVAAVMTAHVVYPAFDRAPATLSRRILTGLLKEQLGFGGVVVTDAIDMKAISAEEGMAAGAVGALRAGADLVCMNSSMDRQEAIAGALADAVADGQLAAARVEDAATRVMSMARSFTLGGEHPQLASPDGVALARRAILAGPWQLRGPLRAAPLVIELLGRSTGIGETKARLTPQLQRLLPATVGEVHPVDSPGDPSQIVAAAQGRPLVVVGRNLRLDPLTEGFVRALITDHPEVTLVALGSAEDRGLGGSGFIPAWGSAPPNMAAVAGILAGS